MDGDHSEPPAAAPLTADDHMDHADLEDVGTEGGDDGMLYNAMDEDEEAEQDAARRLQEELKHKRLVSTHMTRLFFCRSYRHRAQCIWSAVQGPVTFTIC
jgi:hypothetical protein